MPDALYTVRYSELAHVFAGGVLHVLPRHGSPVHAPAAQPNEHGITDAAYVHFPSEHVPLAP